MIHTLQLVTPPMTFACHKRVKGHVYDRAKRNICKIEGDKEKLLFFSLPHHPGIRLCLNSQTVPYVGMIVNPAIILGGGYHDLCQLTPELLNRCMEPINHILREFEMGFTAEQMILSRIDCTVDIWFPQRNAMESFISCIQHTDLARGYHVERFGKQHPNYKEMNRHSFRMACNDVCLTIYDKTYQLMNEGLMDADEVPPDRLRFEAAFCNSAFQRLFLKYGSGIFLNDSDGGSRNKAMIVGFSNLSLRLLQDYFRQHLTPGRYLRKDLAFQLIDKSRFSGSIKSRMKRLIDQVVRCHKGGIGAALGNLEWEGFSQNELQYLMKCFEKINLNPAVISNSAGYAIFPSVIELLSFEGHLIKPFSPYGDETDQVQKKPMRETVG